ncbi:MAG TPA: N-6 DNA methylase [Myxococcaceae bacterium]|jgi:adenine-specific DNA-methyltransferase
MLTDEARRAGGVFYTPRHVVDYILRRTLAPLLDGSTPRQSEELRILDPACGTGCFLVPAYEYLLSWQLGWYRAQPRPERFLRGPDAPLARDAQGQYVLSLNARKRILLNSLFGVDIDARAVRTTRRALLATLFAGAPAQARRGVVPELERNIRCGNTLVDSTHDALGGRRTARAARRLKPLDWKNPRTGFGAIMAGGGFDAIIGNPPYRRERDFKELLDEVANSVFGRAYRRPRMDLWYYFAHRALEHLRDGGRLSFIVNAYWTSGMGAGALIEEFRTRCQLEEFFLLGDAKVFDDVAGQHLIFVASKQPPHAATQVRRIPAEHTGSARPYVEGLRSVEEYQKTHEELFRGGRIDLQPSSANVLTRIEQGQPLETLGLIRQGIAENPADINPRTNERFGGRWTVGQGVFCLSEKELRALRLPASERKLVRPYHDLRDIGRYWANPAPSRYLLYLTRGTCPDLAEHPRLERHLLRFREIMEERRETQNGARKWWHLHWPREPELWTSAKILALQMAERPSFAYAPGECYVPFSVNVFVPRPGSALSPYYILGVLNSRLLWKWFLHRAKRRGVGLEINGNVLRQAPIQPIDFTNAAQVKRHERISTLAQRLSAPRPRKAGLAGLQRQIDLEVYELYGLNTAQRAAVDADTGGH